MKESIHKKKCISDFFEFEFQNQNVILGGIDDGEIGPIDRPDDPDEDEEEY